MKALLLFVLFLSGLHTKFVYASFLPEAAMLSASPSDPELANMDEAEFNQILANINQSYQAIVKAHGGNLQIGGEWKNEKLNAAATQMMGAWRVVITGGLARRPELSADGFTLILCHELGHHLGGFAFAAGGNPFEKAWAANEGQSDYFATHACAKRLWSGELQKNASFREKISDYIRERCDTAWSTQAEQDLCYRISLAAKSVTDTMSGILKKPEANFETPDTAVVQKTLHSHPAVQCRLDTSFQGALCPVGFQESLIPGKKVAAGPASLEAEREAAMVSCTKISGQVFGLRPTCWFSPRL